MKCLSLLFLPAILLVAGCDGSSDHDVASSDQHLTAAPGISATDKIAAQAMMRVVLDKQLLPAPSGATDSPALVKLAIDGQSAESIANISSFSCTDGNGAQVCHVGFGVTPKNPTGPVLVSVFDLEIDLQASTITSAILVLFAG